MGIYFTKVNASDSQHHACLLNSMVPTSEEEYKSEIISSEGTLLPGTLVAILSSTKGRGASWVRKGREKRRMRKRSFKKKQRIFDILLVHRSTHIEGFGRKYEHE